LTKFSELCEICEKIEATSARAAQIRIVSEFLRKTVSPDEVESAVRLVIGKPIPSLSTKTFNISYLTIKKIIQKLTGTNDKEFTNEMINVGDVGASVKMLFEKFPLKTQKKLLDLQLTINEVNRNFESIAELEGPGARGKKEKLLTTLLSYATPLEAKYIVKNLIGEMRHGFSEGLMEEAIANAFNVNLQTVRTANMFLGDLGTVAKIAKTSGEDGLRKIGITVFHPLRPMLADLAKNVEEAIERHGGKTSFEAKLDGARVQIHKKGGEVRVFSRRLTDVTNSVPEIADQIKKEIQNNEIILEGEIIAVSKEGKVLPFQYLMRRLRRTKEISEMMEKIPLKLYLFDLIYIDGESLTTKPFNERRKILENVAGNLPLTSQITTSDPTEAKNFFEKIICEGHEGLVAKQLDSPYTLGVRGKKWLKIKRSPETLDLVIVAAEYGYGYRHAWLSDYYLAAKDTENNKLEIIGKTFKGLTDSEIQKMTKRLMEIALEQKGRTIMVKPEVVVEVAFSEIQRSSHYRGGYALRFARIVRVREDKSLEDVSSLEDVAKIYETQFKNKVGNIN
jgi:DNA ligase-1